MVSVALKSLRSVASFSTAMLGLPCACRGPRRSADSAVATAPAAASCPRAAAARQCRTRAARRDTSSKSMTARPRGVVGSPHWSQVRRVELRHGAAAFGAVVASAGLGAQLPEVGHDRALGSRWASGRPIGALTAHPQFRPGAAARPPSRRARSASRCAANSLEFFRCHEHSRQQLLVFSDRSCPPQSSQYRCWVVHVPEPRCRQPPEVSSHCGHFSVLV